MERKEDDRLQATYSSESEAHGKDYKPWHSYDTIFLNAKAGMGGVDKERVQKVVYEMSKGSKFYENEQRKEAVLLQRIERFREQALQISPQKLSEIKIIVDKKISELEANRDLSKIWMHVDLDAFYAAVEALEDASLSTSPMAVGSMSMICTANYEARKYGVRAAMPGFIACKLCPDLILKKPNFDKYAHYSELTRGVFRLYDKRFIARSMDEAYLDITEVCKRENISASEVAEQLRKEVYEKTKLTCSAGIAPNRLLAKVCSDINKPNGQFVLSSDLEEVMRFISTLPIRKVSGIGKVTERLLKEVLSIEVCGDLIDKRYIISALFSPTSRDFFFSVGLGIGGSETPQEESRKSISCERTFSATSDENTLFKIVGDIVESLAEDVAKEGLRGRTLTLKLKTSTFEVRNRALSVQHFISSKEEIESLAIKLLKSELPLSLRLIGVRISHFHELDPSQKTITSFVKEKSSPEKNEAVCEEENIAFAEEDILESEESLWTDDDRCTYCGLKVSSELHALRQEHEDYHLALKIEQQETGEDKALAQIEAMKKNVGKRTRSQSSSDKSRKKFAGNVNKRNSIDSYFSK